MTWRGFARLVGWVLPVVFLVLLAAGAGVWWYFHPTCERLGRVQYGTRDGHPLTMEIIRPHRPNGLGLMLLVSGSWKSNTNAVAAPLIAPLLRRGYTVFAIAHVSQPESSVMDIVADVQRAVRVVRHSARAYGVDPERLAVTGGSSGGHLSLWLATRGDDGNPASPDPVERESSRVQSVACFFPATDLLNLGSSTENAGDGGPPRSYRAAFREAATNLVVWQAIGRDLSPIYHVTPDLPPILLIHGDVDTLIPLDQSERFVARALEEGVSRIELRVRPGRGHGWPSILWEVREIAAWFDATLRP